MKDREEVMENVATHEEWKVCFAELGPGLVLFARQWVQSIADAEDIVQEAFVRFWRRNHDISNRALAERLVVEDIQMAADVLRPVYDDSDGANGFVSLEVSPGTAHDTGATIAEARHLWQIAGATQRDDKSACHARGRAGC